MNMKALVIVRRRMRRVCGRAGVVALMGVARVGWTHLPAVVRAVDRVALFNRPYTPSQLHRLLVQNRGAWAGRTVLVRGSVVGGTSLAMPGMGSASSSSRSLAILRPRRPVFPSRWAVLRQIRS